VLPRYARQQLFIQGILASYKHRTIKENRHKCDIIAFIPVLKYIKLIKPVLFSNETTSHKTTSHAIQQSNNLRFAV
jgi:hypothetical protein